MRHKFTFPSRLTYAVILVLLLIALILPATHPWKSPLKAEEEVPLLFYASFERNLVADLAFGDETPLFTQSVKIVRDGKKGGAAYFENDALLSYDAPGNIYAQRGTVAFWWRLDEPLGATPFTIVNVSFTQQASWDYSFAQLRWTGESLEFQLKDLDGQTHRITTENKTVLVSGRWFHFAFTWDELDGLALYVDGLPIGVKRKELHLDAALDQIGIHMKQVSPQKTAGNERRVWIDEFRIYASPLNQTQVQNLTELGSGRTGSMPLTASQNPELWNQHWKSRFGWQNSQSLPRIVSPAVIRKLPLAEGRDSGKLVGRANDAKSETGWPLAEFQSSDAGKLLEFDLSQQAFNLLQVQGNFRGQVYQKIHGQKRPLLDDTGPRPRYYQRLLTEPVNTVSLEIQREDGILRELSLFSVEPDAPSRKGGEDSTGSLGSKVAFRLLPADQAGKLSGVSHSQIATLYDQKTRLLRRYVPADRAAWIGVPKEIFPATPPASVQDNALLHYCHVVLPPFLSHTPLDALRLRFNPSNAPSQGESIVCLQIKDPVHSERNLIDVQFKLPNDSPTNLLIDIPDVILPSGTPLVLTFASDFNEFGSRFLTGAEVEIWTSLSERGTLSERGRTEYLSDRLAWLRQSFQAFSTYNSWVSLDYSKLRRQFKGLDELFRVGEDILRFDPKEPAALSYLTWLKPSQAPPDFKQPTVPSADVPLWAFQQRLLVQKLMEIVDWWIRNRQTGSGELGDGLRQDTSMIADWVGIALSDSSAGHIKKSLLSAAEACYRLGLLKDSFGASRSDPLQIYQQGLNLLCASAIVDYGNPLWVERLMESVRHLSRITGMNEAGHRHFRSYLLSATELIEEGTFGREDRYSALLLHPALILAWYNGNPEAKQWLREYANSIDAHWQKDAYPRDHYPKLVLGIRFFTDEVVNRGLPGPDVVNLYWGIYRMTGDSRYLWLLNKLIQSGDTAIAETIGERWLEFVDRENYREAVMNEVERRNIWDHNLQSDETGLLARQTAFELTYKKRYLEEYQSALLKHLSQNRPLYTSSEPATGSIRLPLRAIQKARLGGIAFYDRVTFPGHAVSWEGAQGKLSVIVLKSTPDRLRLVAFNSGESLLDVNMRVWELESGTYEVVEGTDVAGDDQDDQIDVETTRRQFALRRFSEIPISLRSQKRTVIDFKQIKKSSPIQELPDLAIGPSDLNYDPVADKGVLTIHNIGSANSSAFTIVVENEKRMVVLRKEFSGLAAPIGLLPRTVNLDFSGVRGKGNRLLIFRLDPGNQVDELNEENNQIRKVLN